MVGDRCTYQGAGKRPRQCCHPKGGNGAEGPKGPRTKGTATRGPESGQNMRVRGPEGPEDEQSEVPVSALASAIICFSQLSSKSRNSWAVFKTLMSAKNHENCSGASYLQYEYRVKKLGQFMDHIKSYATSKFRKNSKMRCLCQKCTDIPTRLSLSLPLSLPLSRDYF